MELRKRNPQHSRNPTSTGDLTYERSFIPGKVEYRAGEGDVMGEVFGYALKWDVEYDMGWYTERIAKGALDNADLSDVRVLDNHESHLVLGRTKSGTATIGKDETGLWYRATLPNSPNGQNMRESLIRGDIDASSWGFRIRADETGRRTGDKWEKRDGREIRTITDISVVFDTSPVTFPANPDTSAAKRSRDLAFEKRDDMEGEDDDMGESTVVIEPGPADQWEIGWMISNVAWATVTGNDTVRSLNNCISSYGYYAKDDNAEAAIFQVLADSCTAAKTAMVAMIDAHIDALKALNAAENRSKAPETPIEEKTNTLYIAELEQFERRRMQLLN
jgi:uncharacterized protein